ncbi:hypothetical protein COLO4_34223 [Corchorus olitorius]|uniref:BZIP domain-containing protein n=1 Tax=Corchorus olitorius TaxID=93759 RepID=A0A1R3GN14_9ROSI|nr:hypothetical protein COLO4_34223 [Corchorus olitorius]
MLSSDSFLMSDHQNYGSSSFINNWQQQVEPVQGLNIHLPIHQTGGPSQYHPANNMQLPGLATYGVIADDHQPNYVPTCPSLTDLKILSDVGGDIPDLVADNQIGKTKAAIRSKTFREKKKNEFMQMKRENEQLKEENKDLQENYNDVKRRLEDLSVKQNEVNKDKVVLEVKIRHLEQQNQHLSEKLSEANEAKAQLEDKIKHLQRQRFLRPWVPITDFSLMLASRL